MSVLLRGSGLGVAVCAHLLDRAGMPFAVEPGTRRPVPVIMLSDPALAMLRDVFGRPGLFADKPRIERRVVQWGGGEPVAMPHGAIVISEADLTQAFSPDPREQATAPAFTIHAAPPFPSGTLQRFGERRSTAARIRLAAGAEPATCWVESAPQGWLFLIPDGAGGAWLLAVGGAPDDLARQSRVISGLIAAIEPADGSFDTSPRMLTTLAGGDWLACGMSAIAFDPICGDGTAQAAREAILACAVVAALQRGEDRQALLTHYHSMLLAAMRRHLQLSLPFYAQGGTSEWWQQQFAAARAGYDACTARLGALPPPRFALRGFDLVPREQAA